MLTKLWAAQTEKSHYLPFCWGCGCCNCMQNKQVHILADYNGNLSELQQMFEMFSVRNLRGLFKPWAGIIISEEDSNDKSKCSLNWNLMLGFNNFFRTPLSALWISSGFWALIYHVNMKWMCVTESISNICSNGNKFCFHFISTAKLGMRNVGFISLSGSVICTRQ